MPFKSDAHRRAVMAMVNRNLFCGLLVETHNSSRLPKRLRGKVLGDLALSGRHRYVGHEYDEAARHPMREITVNHIARILGYAKNTHALRREDIEFDKPIEMPIRLRKRKGGVYGV